MPHKRKTNHPTSRLPGQLSRNVKRGSIIITLGGNAIWNQIGPRRLQNGGEISSRSQLPPRQIHTACEHGWRVKLRFNLKQRSAHFSKEMPCVSWKTPLSFVADRSNYKTARSQSKVKWSTHTQRQMSDSRDDFSNSAAAAVQKHNEAALLFAPPTNPVAKFGSVWDENMLGKQSACGAAANLGRRSQSQIG